ncbi:MAG: hypothetical protein J0H57_00925 [Rhodospirillales bacterium]|nr:hypothetical protein [Rhodospirillales bacterium]
MEKRIIAKCDHFVMKSPTPQRRFGMANAWEPLGEDLEQFGIDHQFLFLGNAAPDLLLQALQ